MLTLNLMLGTESERLAKTPCPILLGSLWFDQKLGILWQVIRIYGEGFRADLAVIELSGFLYAEGELMRVRRRLTLPDLMHRFHYFGSIHDKTWEGV